jgi:hypothetical protein
MIAKSLFRCAGVLALFSSAQLSAAPAQQCLNETDVHGLVAYMLPSLAETVVERCATRLPAGSYLNTRGSGLVGQLRKGQSAAWPSARDAMVKMAGKDDSSSEMFRSMPESVVGPMMEDMLTDKVGDDLKAQNCKDIDRVLSTMAPLPASNLVDMVTAIAMIAGRDGKKFQTCETV